MHCFPCYSHNNPRKHRGGRQCVTLTLPTEKVEILILQGANFWIILMPNLPSDTKYLMQIAYLAIMYVDLGRETEISNQRIFSLSLVSHTIQDGVYQGYAN